MSAELPEMPGMDTENLYRQETITDLRVGTIQVLTPVKSDGSEDTERPKKFMGTTSVMTPHGAIPVQAEIDAVSLEVALEKFSDAVKASMQKMIEDAQNLEREMRSSIVVPKAGTGGMPGPGGSTMPGAGLEIP